VTGLPLGASATLDFPWNTAGVSTGGHTLIARQMLADGNASNNSRALGVMVNPPSVHVADLDASASRSGNSWSATITIMVHDANHGPVNDVLVRGSWSGTTPNPGECTTGAAGANGTCTVVYSSIPNSTRLVSFAVGTMTRSGYNYQPSANHDPDGSSNGTTIFVNRP
jgi:hypothetical protein